MREELAGADRYKTEIYGVHGGGALVRGEAAFGKVRVERQ